MIVLPALIPIALLVRQQLTKTPRSWKKAGGSGRNTKKSITGNGGQRPQAKNGYEVLAWRPTPEMYKEDEEWSRDLKL